MPLPLAALIASTAGSAAAQGQSGGSDSAMGAGIGYRLGGPSGAPLQWFYNRGEERRKEEEMKRLLQEQAAEKRRQFNIGAAQTTRATNMSGIEMLANMRTSAMEQAKGKRYRDSLLGALQGVA